MYVFFLNCDFNNCSGQVDKLPGDICRTTPIISVPRPCKFVFIYLHFCVQHLISNQQLMYKTKSPLCFFLDYSLHRMYITI